MRALHEFARLCARPSVTSVFETDLLDEREHLFQLLREEVDVETGGSSAGAHHVGDA